jgi:hypothetical protein
MRGFAVEEWPRRDRNHGGADMVQAKSWVAFDVHASGVVAAVLEREPGPV